MGVELPLCACDPPFRLAPHLGLLAVRNSDSQSVFDASRSLQRLWLAETSQGRSRQPMPASALYALDWARRDGIPAELQHDLAEGSRKWLAGAIPLTLSPMGVDAVDSPGVAARDKDSSGLSACKHELAWLKHMQRVEKIYIISLFSRDGIIMYLN